MRAMTGTVLDLSRGAARLTADLVDIESVSGDEKALADAIEEALRACPHLEVVRDGDSVLARTNLGRAERVILAGHLDTVPIAVDSKGRRNVPSLLDGDWQTGTLYGCGTGDMKAGVAVQLVLAATVPEPNRDLTYVFYECEEVEAERNSLRRLVETRADWFRADFAVLLEPSSGIVEGGCQGTLRARITLRGERAHSARSWLGANAIHRAAPVLQRLAAYEPRRAVVDGLEYREGLNAVGIEGGVAGNVIPDTCSVLVNYRFAPDRDEVQAEAHVREVFAGIDAEIEVTDSAPGARPGLDLRLASEFVDAVMTGMDAVPLPKFGWTDVSRFAALGIPGVNYGPGDNSLAHKPDESVDLGQVVQSAERMRSWLVDTP
jgi:succinyl-diaminopimelate desuccinylase